MPRFQALLATSGQVLALVKPQFEAGPGHLGKGSIVRDASLYPVVAARIRAACAACGLAVLDWFEAVTATANSLSTAGLEGQ